MIRGPTDLCSISNSIDSNITTNDNAAANVFYHVLRGNETVDVAGRREDGATERSEVNVAFSKYSVELSTEKVHSTREISNPPDLDALLPGSLTVVFRLASPTAPRMALSGERLNSDV